MQIRKLTPADAAAFQQMRLAALQEMPLAFSSSFEEECERPLASVAARLAPADHRTVLGAFEDSSLVAIAGLTREEMAKLKHKGFIWGMYVAPSHRHHGLGRQLLLSALQHAKDIAGLRQVNLSVNGDNRAAKALYESVGFVAFGVEKHAMLVAGELHDEIHMVYVLPQTDPLV